MSIAVIKTGGKQYKVEEGDEVNIELIDGKKKTLQFEDILDGKKVSAEIINKEIKGPKIRILKFKNKVRYIKRKGHRQKYTKVKITAIK